MYHRRLNYKNIIPVNTATENARIYSIRQIIPKNFFFFLNAEQPHQNDSSSVGSTFIAQQSNLIETQQLQQQHHSSTTLSSQQQQQAQPTHRVQYIHRTNVGNFLNVISDPNGSGSNSNDSNCSNISSVNNQQIKFVSASTVHHANVAPGWRRQLADGEIVYFR